LKARLQPTAATDSKRVRRLIADLDSDKFRFADRPCCGLDNESVTECDGNKTERKGLLISGQAKTSGIV
jgi:hypothetical protein